MKNEIPNPSVMPALSERLLPDYVIKFDCFDENTYWSTLDRAIFSLDELVKEVTEYRRGALAIAEFLTNLYGGKAITVDFDPCPNVAENRHHIASLIYFCSMISKPISHVLPMSPKNALLVYSFHMEKALVNIFRKNIYK